MSTEFKELIAVVLLKKLLRQPWLNVILVIINNCVNLPAIIKKNVLMLNEKTCSAISRKVEWLESKNTL